ncbi:MAG: glycosyltransferase [Candidatus Jordarchaeaceae archaeon]
MLISVVVPTLNEQDNIERCLRSIILQEVSEPFEVIVCDGGSIDGTVSIAERYADKVVLSSEKGACAQRNLGAKVSGGIYWFSLRLTVLFLGII